MKSVADSVLGEYAEKIWSAAMDELAPPVCLGGLPMFVLKALAPRFLLLAPALEDGVLVNDPLGWSRKADGPTGGVPPLALLPPLWDQVVDEPGDPVVTEDGIGT